MSSGNEGANSPAYPAAHASENGIAVGFVNMNGDLDPDLLIVLD